MRCALAPSLRLKLGGLLMERSSLGYGLLSQALLVKYLLLCRAAILGDGGELKLVADSKLLKGSAGVKGEAG